MANDGPLSVRGVAGDNRRTLLSSSRKRARPAPPVPEATGPWALFLDVDGTLLDLEPTPDAVRVPAGLAGLLANLRRKLDGALAFVSGRPIATLDRLFAPLEVPCAGLHGVERRDARGHLHRATQDESILCELRRSAFELARALPGVLVEDKHYTVALHYTRAQEHQAALFAAAAAIAGRTGFELQAGHNIYELKPPGADKGAALTAFLEEAPFLGRRPVFLGDDLTDEYAHAVTRGHGGMAIQVGARCASVAQFMLEDPASVLRWLRRWDESLP